MKKLIALLLALVMVLGLVACGAKDDAPAADAPADAPAADAPADAPAESTGKRIFMSAAYYTAPYGSPLMKAIQEKGEAEGYEGTIVDGEVNADKQLTQFKTAVADGYDALVYWPGDSASTPPVVEYLNSTGLPWVVVNTVPLPELYDQCTIIASDELQIGRELGKLIVQYYEEKGSEPLNIAYIEGDSGSSYTINLTAGIHEVIDEYADIKILNEAMYSNFDPAQAMTIMEDLITKYGNEIDLVVTQDGGMFQGAYNAIVAAGKLGEYGIICQGQDLIVKEKLESGELYASVAQDPFQEGSLAIEILIKKMNGEEVDAWSYTPTGPIFAADTANYAWF